MLIHYNTLQFTPYFAFSACVILYVYTIQRSKEQEEVYRPYFTAAERCQQQIVDIADEGTLTSRYCLVLEELRAEAARQTNRAQAFHQATQTQGQSSIDMGAEDSDPLASNAEGMAQSEFNIAPPDLAVMGSFDDLYVSPSGSLEDLTGWDQFDSMVSIRRTDDAKVANGNTTMYRWYLGSMAYTRLCRATLLDMSLAIKQIGSFTSHALPFCSPLDNDLEV